MIQPDSWNMAGRPDCEVCKRFDVKIKAMPAGVPHREFFAVWSPYVKHIKAHAR